MRTKRGGYKQNRTKPGKARVRIRATGAALPPKHHTDRVRIAPVERERLDLSDFRIVSIGGREIDREHPKAGLLRILSRRAPRHLWA